MHHGPPNSDHSARIEKLRKQIDAFNYIDRQTAAHRTELEALRAELARLKALQKESEGAA